MPQFGAALVVIELFLKRLQISPRTRLREREITRGQIGFGQGVADVTSSLRGIERRRILKRADILWA